MPRAPAQRPPLIRRARRRDCRGPIESRTLPNGLRLLVLPDPAQAKLSAGLVVGAGWVHNPRGKEGLVDLAAALDRLRVRQAIENGQTGKSYLAGEWSATVSSDHTLFAATGARRGSGSPVRDHPRGDPGGRGAVPRRPRAQAGRAAQAPANARGRGARRARGARGGALRRPPPAWSLGALPDAPRRLLGRCARAPSRLLRAGERGAVRGRPGHRRPSGGGGGPPLRRLGGERTRHADLGARTGRGGAPGRDARRRPRRRECDSARRVRRPRARGSGLRGDAAPAPGDRSGRLEAAIASLAATHPAGYQFRSQLRASARGSEITIEIAIAPDLAARALAEIERGLGRSRPGSMRPPLRAQWTRGPQASRSG